MEHSCPQEPFNAVFDQMLSRPDYHLLGAVLDGEKLIGSVMGIISLDLKRDCRPQLFMENMVVHPEYRSLGAGKLLLGALEQIGRENNCFFIQFCSSWQRTEAHRFYEEKMGYDPSVAKGYRKFL